MTDETVQVAEASALARELGQALAGHEMPVVMTATAIIMASILNHFSEEGADTAEVLALWVATVPGLMEDVLAEGETVQ